MKKIAIVVHGGAGPDSDHIKENKEGYEKGIEEAIDAGYRILKKGGSAVDAVEAAVKKLEDNPVFNAGRGSALNAKAEVETCASIMRGEDLASGAVAIVRNVKNPVSLARALMEKSKHIYLGNQGALEFAKEANVPLAPDSYFITEHQYEAFEEKMKELKGNSEKRVNGIALQEINERMHGTVGAVALDISGKLAAATSTGGTEGCHSGRIGDTSMIGVGCYANNDTIAVSTTGDGEYLIQHVIGFQLSSVVEYKNLPLKEAAHYLIKDKLKHVEGDMGLIAVDPKGNIALEFNSERMHRGYRTSDGQSMVAIYPGEG
ncbi:MAG TPA: isoaspartyl peptidase/L-asparaginase [Flavisolibacter sp.]|nr:isoaspartyl peptidase/L-asparaginase [Flavisolibacter sp.]